VVGVEDCRAVAYRSLSPGDTGGHHLATSLPTIGCVRARRVVTLGSWHQVVAGSIVARVVARRACKVRAMRVIGAQAAAFMQVALVEHRAGLLLTCRFCSPSVTIYNFPPAIRLPCGSAAPFKTPGASRIGSGDAR
jgi:hypothetical protein